MDEDLIRALDKQYSAKMAALGSPPYDEEVGHYEADRLLCLLLRSVGFTKVVDEFEKLGKWYA